MATFAPCVSCSSLVQAVKFSTAHPGQLKLSVGQHGALPMERVVCQGYVIKAPNSQSNFQIADVPEADAKGVKVAGKWAAEDVRQLKLGSYVQVTGALKAAHAQPRKDTVAAAAAPTAAGVLVPVIHAHKVCCLEEAAEHAEVWMEHLAFLDAHVYPCIASSRQD